MHIFQSYCTSIEAVCRLARKSPVQIVSEALPAVLDWHSSSHQDCPIPATHRDKVCAIATAVLSHPPDSPPFVARVATTFANRSTARTAAIAGTVANGQSQRLPLTGYITHLRHCSQATSFSGATLPNDTVSKQRCGLSLRWLDGLFLSCSSKQDRAGSGARRGSGCTSEASNEGE